MPGLVGFTANAVEPTDRESSLRAMQDLLVHHAWNAKDPLCVGEGICATRVAPSALRGPAQPYEGDGVRVWLEGEWFNHTELLGTGGDVLGDAEALGRLYLTDDSLNFLPRVDGIYSAVIHDSKQMRLHLVTDRYGLAPLYWTRRRGGLVWASEFKAMLGLSGWTPRIDHSALDEFLGHWYIMADHTWFEDVRALPPGTLMTVDLQTHRQETTRYWSFHAITPVDGRLSETELADELGRRLIESVRERCRTEHGERMGLTLSGGLDSRAILAAAPDHVRPLCCVTFGAPGCRDIRYARQAAALRHDEHHCLDLGADRWLESRFPGVWWSEGQNSLMHMHALAHWPHMKQLFDVNLNGFLGDAIGGGSYMGNPSYTETWGFQNRGGRWMRSGLRMTDAYIHQRMPFFDNDFVDLALSIPPAMRRGSYVYCRALLQAFPLYFRSIPWQKTGLRITTSRLRNRLHETYRHFMRVAGARLIPAGRRRIDFVNYAAMIREEPAWRTISEILRDREAVYPEFVAREKVYQQLDLHASGLDRSKVLLHFLTLEIWLRQVFQGKYRPETTPCAGL